MAIKRRIIAAPVEQPMAQIIDTDEGTIDFDSLDTDLPVEVINVVRMGVFIDGNDNNQPHPKEEPLEKLLSMVRHVQNPDDPQFANMEAFYRNRIRSPQTGIRAHCVMCMGGPRAANSCTSTGCPLWAFRTGKNSFFGKNGTATEDDTLTD